MKLNPNTYPYDFSINSDETIDYIFLYDNRNKKKDVELFLKEIISNNELTIGNGCEGNIDISKDKITVYNTWIFNILNDEELVFPNE